MNKHFWSWPIATYLFLGGLGGGILFLTMLLDFAYGGLAISMALPVAIAVVALGLGCFFLVFELGQPTVFTRVFLKAKAIIKWGAVLLSVAMIAAFIWWLSFLPWAWTAGIVPARGFLLFLAGITGLCVVIYTGVLLASLKAHSFWSTPALPVLFTVSGLSTACAAISLSVGVWPAGWPGGGSLIEAHAVYAFVHQLDIVLVICELAVLFIYLALMLGAGNVVGKTVATRWLKGSFAPLFWGGMVVFGLGIPLLLYVNGVGHIAAAVLVLCGGLLLRFMIVYSDDRRRAPGEAKFFANLPKGDEQFITAWKDKPDLY